MSEQRSQAEMALDAALRIDEEDADLTAARRDDGELIDRLFSELVDEHDEIDEPQDEIR